MTILINEETIRPSDNPNVLSFWHGGDLNDYEEPRGASKGRFEYGVGMYLVTDYSTAKKYAKGSRKLYMVDVEKGNDINKIDLNTNSALEFVKTYCTNNKKAEVASRISKYGDAVKAYIFNNIVLNNEAIAPKNTIHLKNFLVRNNVDYDYMRNPFGAGNMMVLYNVKKIVRVKQVLPKDTIEKFDIEHLEN